MNLDIWPPPYQIKINKRAKRISLRICPQDGLKLILPKPSSEKLGIQFLNANRSWVESRLKDFKPKIKTLPETIHLLALMQKWPIRYERVSFARKTKLLSNINEIVLYGKDFEYDAVLSLLNRWLREKATNHLIEWTQRLSNHCHLPIQSITIRTQKTRWGSCTHDKEIILNDRLLFLPDYCVDYIIIHELCHTVHLNHSKAFWELVESFVPEYRAIRNSLRKLQHELPF
ncbi:MAG: M48 family metallopeptidase [Gammaproteobacteria bacterium]